MKKKLVVSFSGGETSGFMAWWLWNNKRDEYDMIFVFANTGEENEETLEFVHRCEEHFGFPVVWVEALINPVTGKGTRYLITDFDNASRKGQPFEEHIKKYGIPNPANPQCSRELKEAPITSFANEIFGRGYYTAIGIRSDEADRISAKAKKRRLIYPLINREMMPMTKPKINFWWRMQPFRLELKGYEGNCKWCWKKNLKKLLRIAKDDPKAFEFPLRMEKEYGQFFPTHRLEKFLEEGKTVPENITFFRENISAKQIMEWSITSDPKIKDDARNYAIQQELDLIGGESCEIFANCGD